MGREKKKEVAKCWFIERWLWCGCRWHEKRKSKKTCWPERARTRSPRSSRSEGGLWPRSTTLKTRAQISRTGLHLENNFTISGELDEEERTYVYLYGERKENKSREKKKWRNSMRACLNGPPCPDGTCTLVTLYKGRKRGWNKKNERSKKEKEKNERREVKRSRRVKIIV